MLKVVRFLPLVAFTLLSCDFVLKDAESSDNQQVQGVLSDATPMEELKEDSVCMDEAGYKYSLIYQDCIRPFERGFRLNPVLKLNKDQVYEENDLEQNGLSCFVIFSDTKDKVEIFLPEMQKGFLLDLGPEPSIYTNENWVLNTKENYELVKDSQVLFSSASPIEVSIQASDEVLD